jgi:hypothetical protein
MLKATFFALVALGALLLLETASPRAASADWDLKTNLARAQSAFSREKYGVCVFELGLALSQVGKLRAARIEAFLPPAPEGFEVDDSRPSSPRPAAAAGGTAEVRRLYRGAGERLASSVTLTVVADSPLAGMLLPLITNPALIGGDRQIEVVVLGAHKGILRSGRAGGRPELQIVLNGAHLLEVKAERLSRDDLLRFLSPDAIERVAGALADRVELSSTN